jgi:hypothetical protein
MGWAIYSDYSGVTELEGATHPTELAAVERLIQYLEGERARTSEKLAKAKRRLRKLTKDTPNEQ